jgi:PAS domain S-box-containing protein
MSEENAFGTTMRIDLSPEVLRSLQAPAPHRPRSGDATGVIRIRAKSPDSPPASNDDFRKLLQSLYDAAILTTDDGRIIDANVRAEQFFHTTAAFLAGHNILELLNGADASLLSAIHSSLAARSFVLIQVQCIRADGETFPSEIAVGHLPLATPCLAFYVRDVTIRRDTELSLQTGITALRTAASGIAVVTPAGAFTKDLNPALTERLGLPPPPVPPISSERQKEYNAATAAYAKDISRFSLGDFIPDARVRENVCSAVAGARAWNGEFRMRALDGREFWARAVLAPNVTAEGDCIGAVVSVLDVTEERAAKEGMERYMKQLAARNAEMETDLRMARDVQMALLPSSYPKAACGGARLGFAHVYHPSGLVGGDFFSLVPVSDHEVLVFMADVMGHGPRAAMIVATLRGLIDQFAREASGTGEFMTSLNAAYSRIFSGTDEVVFATGIACKFDVAARKLETVNAGHPHPVARRADGRYETGNGMNLPPAPALGLLPDAEYTAVSREFLPGERLLFFTDGLSEAEGETGGPFGEDGILEGFRAGDAAELSHTLKEIVSAARRKTGQKEFNDDICLLGVEFLGAAAEPPRREE